MPAHPRRQSGASATKTPAPAPNAAGPADYFVDATQRAALFMETLLDRGNDYAEHLENGTPPLLKFEFETVLDGRDLPDPCNYALLRFLAPEDLPVKAEARPVVVVDPRAGHGPGIGGFKFDSEVGVAMRAGHAVYFITFRPQPEDQQTLGSVLDAEARFIEEVIALHPQCPAKPVVIGNCQAGWAMAALNALRPELFGPLMVVGAPLSYWAGSATLNPMRYSGATLGGSWLASLAADLGAGRFDGADLVKNFERLNPAHTLWGKYYKLWANVDTEAPRFLEFERWWGGFFRMTTSEIESIVEQLFVGNRLARGEFSVSGKAVDLRNITSPMVVFASWGDNITPPPQALNWIIDTWGDERAIAAAGRTIIYVLHENVGHLGIFVGGDIARKEHDQLVASLDMIESLPPGLYEMKLESKSGLELQRWDHLEPGDYTVHYRHRTMDDIRALNPEGREEEALFSTVQKVSEQNANFYKTWCRPWVQLWAQPGVADVLGRMHPLRMQRQLLSDSSPFAPLIRRLAQEARDKRLTLAEDHPMRELEQAVSEKILNLLDEHRDRRDAAVASWARLVYGPWGLGAWFKPDPSDAERAQTRAQTELAQAREAVLLRIHEGGFAQAVCRIVLAGMVSIGSFERRSFRIARLLAQQPPGAMLGGRLDNTNWVQLLKDQACITAVAPIEALNALPQLLPDRASRERALAVSAAVMMIEPTLDHPRSEIIELVMGMLDVDPQRVIAQARALTQALENPIKPQTKKPRLTPAKQKIKPKGQVKKQSKVAIKPASIKA